MTPRTRTHLSALTAVSIASLAASSLALAQATAPPGTTIAAPSPWVSISSTKPPVPVAHAFVAPKFALYDGVYGKRLGIYTGMTGQEFYWSAPPLLTATGMAIGVVEESVPPGSYSQVAVAALGRRGLPVWQHGVPSGGSIVGPAALPDGDLACVLRAQTEILVMLTTAGKTVSRLPLGPLLPQGMYVQSVTPIAQGLLLTLTNDNPQNETWGLLALSSAGQVLWTSKNMVGSLDGENVAGIVHYVNVSRSTALLVTSPPTPASGGFPMSLVAIDLATGAQAWTKRPFGPRVPVGVTAAQGVFIPFFGGRALVNQGEAMEGRPRA